MTKVRKLSNILQLIIDKANKENKKSFFMGDNNLDCLKYDHESDVKKFYDPLFSLGAFPLINKPTRVSIDSATIINNIITSEIFDETLKRGIIKCDISDHFLILFSLDISRKRIQCTEKVLKSDINQKNKADFLYQLSHLHWRHIDWSGDVNDIYDNFIKTFTDAYEANFPLLEVKVNPKTIESPWIGKGLKKSSKTKQKLHIAYLKEKTSESLEKYKSYKNQFEKLRKKAKKNYYNRLFEKYYNDSRCTWNIMKEIIGKNKTKINSLPTTIKINENNVSDSCKIAAELNKFFVNVGPTLAQNIPEVDGNFKDYIEEPNSLFVNYPLSFDKFEKAVKSLRRNKAAGYDNINSNIVIECFNEIKRVLFKIFRTSIAQSKFPDSIKIAKVTPLFKSGDQTNVSNYRPTSVLPVFF